MSTVYPYERLEHASTVYQSRESTYRSRSCVDVIPIKVQRWKAYGNYNPETHQYDKEGPIVQSTNTLKLRFSREKASGDAKTTMERLARYKRIIAGSPREANKLRDKLRRCGRKESGCQVTRTQFPCWLPPQCSPSSPLLRLLDTSPDVTAARSLCEQ
ncbi:PREDICTED: uncharacterized protein LOC101300781 isoform X2 [Fragaria vesca subsp. vesca]|uniref:uncharacterized protein LOC101300781 isoform X2 n=1 Tax=Fragaria vesca subsp. vesca TaxID=101020 RepID=UPI0002C323CA|nr:PREDICTED: uncharacterized protein LOC101300781 isoform X2 [Fragaria vesca subsp. vesca]